MSLNKICCGEPSFESLMLTHDTGIVVLRQLAATQERVRVCRSISKDCRDIIDGGVRQLKANLQHLSNPTSKLQLNFPKLEELSLDRVSGSANGMLLQLAQHKPHLLQHLRSLDLSGCQGLEANTLEQLLIACKQLRNLKLPGITSNVSSARQEFLEVLCMHGSQLTHLAGAGDYICSATVHLLATLTNLQSLDIMPEWHINKIDPAALQPLSNLQHLQLGGHLDISEACTLAVRLPQLCSLEFSLIKCLDSSYVSGSNCLAPLASCRRLQRLCMGGVLCDDALMSRLARSKVSSFVQRAGTFSASPKGASLLQQQLKQLQLNVAGESIAHLAAALPQLKGLEQVILSVHNSSMDSSKLFQAIFGLTGLQQLSLKIQYGPLSECELTGLAKLPRLANLSLSNHLSDATLHRILSRTSHLQHLELVSCSAVSDTGLSRVMSCCPMLRSVHLELMRGITVSGVSALAGCQYVQRIVLEGCRNVTAEECWEVMKASGKPDLEVIKLK